MFGMLPGLHFFAAFLPHLKHTVGMAPPNCARRSLKASRRPSPICPSRPVLSCQHFFGMHWDNMRRTAELMRLPGLAAEQLDSAEEFDSDHDYDQYQDVATAILPPATQSVDGYDCRWTTDLDSLRRSPHTCTIVERLEVQTAVVCGSNIQSFYSNPVAPPMSHRTRI